MASEKQDKIYWHDAFFEALQLELSDYEDVLKFENEHLLSKEALQIDVVVIKKEPGVVIEKNVGRQFRTYNLVEYKSEKDKLTIWDYNKMAGYANLYSAFEEVPIKEMTLTFVVTPKPSKLLEHLAKDRGFVVKEEYDGIYYVKGDFFPIQIIESKKLSDDENIFLRGLRSNLSAEDVDQIFQKYAQKTIVDKRNAFINRIIEANRTVLKEVGNMSEETKQILKEIMKENGFYDEIIAKSEAKGEARGEARGEAKGAERNAMETAKNMLKKGMAPDLISEVLNKPVEWVNNLQH